MGQWGATSMYLEGRQRVSSGRILADGEPVLKPLGIMRTCPQFSKEFRCLTWLGSPNVRGAWIPTLDVGGHVHCKPNQFEKLFALPGCKDGSNSMTRWPRISTKPCHTVRGFSWQCAPRIKLLWRKNLKKFSQMEMNTEVAGSC